VTFTPTDTANYNTAVKTDVSITVAKANPTVSTWPTAPAITYGAALSASTLTGGASTPAGTFEWTDGTIVPPLGNSEYSVTFTPTDAANYNTVVKTDVSITVNNITYAVSQVGGAGGVTTTTGLSFTFNGSIANMGITAADITIGGVAAKGSAVFNGSGASWTLSPIQVSSSGDVTVSISKPGIESQSKTVQVYYATGSAGISVTFAQITDAASGITVPMPVLHRVSGTPTASLVLADPGQYDTNSISWRVNGTEIGTGNTVTLNANNPANNTLGTHYLTISVQKNGVSYNKTIPFTVAF
jgi:hypothetical protein